MKKLIVLALVSLSVVSCGCNDQPSPATRNGPGEEGDRRNLVRATPATASRYEAVPAHWVFNAIEGLGSPAKGNVFYKDHVRLLHREGHPIVTVDRSERHVHCRGHALAAHLYAEVGHTFTWTVRDIAEQGVGNDYFTYHQHRRGRRDLPAITAGNVQVHA